MAINSRYLDRLLTQAQQSPAGSDERNVVFLELEEINSPWLMGTCKAIITSSRIPFDLHQDLAQNFYFKLTKSLHLYEPGTFPKSWFKKMLKNLFLDLLKAEKFREVTYWYNCDDEDFLLAREPELEIDLIRLIQNCTGK